MTGVFNRLARSCFYGVAIKEGDESPYRNGRIPAGAASATVVEAAEQAVLAFEQAMYRFETHRALAVWRRLPACRQQALERRLQGRQQARG